MLARHCPGACVQIGSRYLETARWGPSPTEAAPLVLLHEGLGCVALWRDVPERLAEATGCGVCAYSRFGYGRSDPQPLPWKLTYMQDEARDILPQVLDEACIRDAVLVGHSDGGSIAAVYAGAARDRRLRGVVLMAAHFFVEDSNIARIAKIRADYRQGPLRERLARYHRDPDIAFHGWCDSWLDGFSPLRHHRLHPADRRADPRPARCRRPLRQRRAIADAATPGAVAVRDRVHQRRPSFAAARSQGRHDRQDRAVRPAFAIPRPEVCI